MIGYTHVVNYRVDILHFPTKERTHTCKDTTSVSSVKQHDQARTGMGWHSHVALSASLVPHTVVHATVWQSAAVDPEQPASPHDS